MKKEEKERIIIFIIAMTTSLGKRSSINGISDIAYTIEKSPIYTSTDQFIQGVKTFCNPIKAISNIFCTGKYYGDGSKLLNLPVQFDATKLPLAGGVLSGPLINNSSTTLNGNLLVDGGYDSTFCNIYVPGDNLIQLGDFNDLVCQINRTSITTSNINTAMMSALSSDELRVEPNPWGAKTHFSALGTIVDHPTGQTVYTKYGCGIENSACNFNIFNEVTDPNEVNPHLQFVKMNCGQSLKLGPSIHVATGDNLIMKNDHFLVFEEGYGDPNEAFRFDKTVFYLDDLGRAGYTVILSNYSGGDIVVNQIDNTSFYGHNFGEGTHFFLKKWATARVTLVELPSGSYRWAVSQF